MKNPITIRDVAKKAQVSKSAARAAFARTASNVRIAPATRERILSVARNLKYRPNIMARCLNHRKSFLLGFYFNENSWHVAAQLIRSIQEACRPHDYSLIVYPSANLAEERRNLQLGLDRHLDGILATPFIASGGDNRIEYQRIARDIMPVVQILFKLCPELPAITRDYRQIGRDAVEYLRGLGHRRIGLVTFSNYEDPVQGVVAFGHFQGYREAMAEADEATAIFPIQATSPNGHVEASHENAKKILASPYAPTALIASANSLAYGTIMYLREHGVRVPEDISIIGSANDIELPHGMMPPLTFFPIHFDTIGKMAVEKCLDASGETSAKEIYLRQEIKEGATVCRNLKVQ